MIKKSFQKKSFLKEFGKFLCFLLPVFLIVFLFFNFGAFWENAKYELSRIFPARTNIIGEASVIKMFEDGFSREIDKVFKEDTLFIPKINVKSPILIPKTTSEKDFFNVLKEGVALYPQFSKPGEGEITIITGHSSPNLAGLGKYNTVFSLLNKLGKEDKIIIYFEEQKYIYKVISKNIFSPGEELSRFKKNKKEKLVLTTCWPIGTNFKRIGIEAELVK